MCRLDPSGCNCLGTLTGRALSLAGLQPKNSDQRQQHHSESSSDGSFTVPNVHSLVPDQGFMENLLVGKIKHPINLFPL